MPLTGKNQNKHSIHDLPAGQASTEVMLYSVARVMVQLLMRQEGEMPYQSPIVATVSTEEIQYTPHQDPHTCTPSLTTLKQVVRHQRPHVPSTRNKLKLESQYSL